MDAKIINAGINISHDGNEVHISVVDAEWLRDCLHGLIEDFWEESLIPVHDCSTCGTSGSMEYDSDGPDAQWWKCSHCGAQVDAMFDDSRVG